MNGMIGQLRICTRTALRANCLLYSIRLSRVLSDNCIREQSPQNDEQHTCGQNPSLARQGIRHQREAAQQNKVELAAVSEISEKPGAGLSGTIGATTVQITGRKKVPAAATAMLPPVAPGMECILMLDGKYGATFRFRDAPRQESRSFISHLAPKHSVSRVILLSGDRETEVRYLAGQVGITEALFGKSPEERVAIVREEATRAPTLFVGDGINDAPAMQAATVGIAFGQNSDVTAEAADAVVLEPSLRKVDELIHIGRRMRKIALQSAVGGMGLSMVGMLIAAAGYLPRLRVRLLRN